MQNVEQVESSSYQPTKKDAHQAIALMFVATILSMLTTGPSDLGAVAALSYLILAISAMIVGLVSVESIDQARGREPLLKCCIPALGIIGFCGTLLAASGFWLSAALVFGTGAFVAVFRRLHIQGLYNIAPASTADLGLVAGIGSATAGVLLTLIDVFAG